MLFKSRVITSIDTGRLAEAVSYPGIDSRIWVSYAVLTTEPYFETEKGYQDVVADVLLLPSNMPETARVGAAYAGNGFGLYMPLKKDDEVLVVAPSGNPDQGLVIAQRLWSPADLPPSEAQAAPQDVTLVVEPGKNLRLNVKGEGNVYLAVDAGKVFLGSADETEPATKGTSLKAYLDQLATDLNNHVHNIVEPTPGKPTTPSSMATPPITFAAPTDAILATTTEVK